MTAARPTGALGGQPAPPCGIRLRVAALDDIIASKEANGRAKDRAQLAALYELAAELSRRGQEQGRDPDEGAGRHR